MHKWFRVLGEKVETKVAVMFIILSLHYVLSSQAYTDAIISILRVRIRLMFLFIIWISSVLIIITVADHRVGKQEN